jgi:hypothetical protein
VKLLTGNDLASGDVIWWTGSGWSRHVADAVDVGSEGEAILAAEQDARRVNAAYLIDASASPQGPRPAHIKERIRALGPTVRLDLSHVPDANAATVVK